MQNWREEKTIPIIVKEVRSLLKAGNYLSALIMTLTIPDSLGAVAYPELKGRGKTKERYIRWFDENVRNFFGLLYSDHFYEKHVNFCGKICYQLRCKLLHESTNQMAKETGIDEFVLCFNNERVLTGNTSGSIERLESEPNSDDMRSLKKYAYLYVGITEICTDIIDAAEAFVIANPRLDFPTLKINRGGGKTDASAFVKDFMRH